MGFVVGGLLYRLSHLVMTALGLAAEALISTPRDHEQHTKRPILVADCSSDKTFDWS